MKRLRALLISLSSLSMLGLFGAASHTQTEALSCTLPEGQKPQVAPAAQSQEDSRIYYVGCGGLF